jgi:TonB family protein
MWLENLAAYSLQMAALILAGTALVYLFRLKAPTVLLVFWQALLAVCLLLPVIQPWRQARQRIPDAWSSSSIPPPLLSGITESEVVSPGPAPDRVWSIPIPKYDTVVLILAAGVGLRLLWLALGTMRLRRYRDKSRRLAAFPDAIRDVPWRVGVSAEIFLSTEIDTPVTFGWRKPAVLFPASFAEMGENLQRPIACHELLHVRRRDWLFIVLEEILRSLFWFHPAIWWALGRIHLSREQVVDREVLRVTGQRGPYLESLLQIASMRGRPAAVPAPLLLKERHLVQRVALMLKESKMTRSRLIFSLVAITALLLWTGSFATGMFPLAGRPMPEAPAPVPATVSTPLPAPAPAAASAPAATIPAKAQKREPVRVGSAVQESKLMRKIVPAYPELAKRAHIDGVVTLQVDINEDGTVTAVRVLDGHPLLQQAAIDAVKQWRYSTTLLNGEPVPVQTTVNVEFKLSGVEFVQPTTTPAVTGMISGITGGASPQSANPAPPSPRGTPVRVGGAVQESKIISKVDPVYPPLAKQARVEATVILEVTVNEQGEVASVRVLQSHPLLEQAAIDAVKQWRYSPTLLNGVAVPVVATVTVEFSLSAMHVTLDPDGNLKDQQGQPVSLQQLKESKDDILVSAGAQVPFAVIESTLKYLQYQGIQNVRLGSGSYSFLEGRLFHKAPSIITFSGGMQSSNSNSGIQAPVLDIDVDHLAALAKGSPPISSLPAGAMLSLNYMIYVSEKGEVVAVQSNSLFDVPEIVTALRQARVITPGRLDGTPVPTAATISIRIK